MFSLLKFVLSRVAGSVLWYRITTVLVAVHELYFLDQLVIDQFLESYDVFDNQRLTRKGESKIRDYYRVLNILCSVGQVEKMYIPPLIDGSAGVLRNQVLFEEKMAKDIGLDSTMKVLELGCGRGRIAAHVASLTGARVSGINIDQSQVENAKINAKQRGMEGMLSFDIGSFNDPLPYEDNSFDALYQVQALTYMTHLDKLFSEMYRVLKPGAKISFLDWFKLPTYDPNNEMHLNIMERVKPLIGAVATPLPREFEEGLQRAGFKVLRSEEASVGGHQWPLIQKADSYYRAFAFIVSLLVTVRVLPFHFKVLFDRLTLDADSMIEGDKMGLFTTTYHIVAEKSR